MNTTTEIIKVENLKRKFNGFTAVDSISFAVKKGEVFGFLGPNGAGKTTTINMLCTLLRPTSGQAFVACCDVAKEPNRVRKEIGIIFQDPSLDDRLTAEDNLKFHGYLYNMDHRVIEARIKDVLTLVELYDRRKDYVKKFSGGMKRRLEIARGLLHQPKLLFLDEPTLGLDPQTRAHIWEYILKMRQEHNLSIFMTTHYMQEAEVCDRVAIIDHGKIVDLDAPANLKSKYNETTLEGVFLKITGKDIRPQAGESAWTQWMRRT
ncbi:MAG: ATP-binding cassette domain-containing protein [Candidatus Margulisbacteria bacterium]|nr:ATP-binding cassette domain-containing protein [Candidatus Margulisiibacteriota bacterium]